MANETKPTARYIVTVSQRYLNMIYAQQNADTEDNRRAVIRRTADGLARVLSEQDVADGQYYTDMNGLVSQLASYNITKVPGGDPSLGILYSDDGRELCNFTINK